MFLSLRKKFRDLPCVQSYLVCVSLDNTCVSLDNNKDDTELESVSKYFLKILENTIRDVSIVKSLL